MDMNFICCFTGHRNIPAEHLPLLKNKLFDVLDILIRSGTTKFRTGGALGFDTLAALAVLDKRDKYPHISLELCLPCRDQTKSWAQDDIDLYNSIIEHADKVTLLQESYTPDCMLKRNRYMVDGAQFCVAYCKDENARRGGTAYTVRYARKQNVKVVDLYKML